MFLLLFKVMFVSVSRLRDFLKDNFMPSGKKTGLDRLRRDSDGSNGNQVDGKVLQTFQKSFVQVQDILDQNRLLINEINQNHESKIPDNLTRNVGLIKELNNNIRRVVDLYADLSSNFTRSMEPSSEGESSGILKSNGKANSKRIRSGSYLKTIPTLFAVVGEVEAGNCAVTLSIIVLLDYSSFRTIAESNFIYLYLSGFASGTSNMESDVVGEDMSTLRGRKVINQAGAVGPSDSLSSGAGRTLLILYY
ncbi:hypothetical protein NC651_008252 [Populus alba x Populus x berolinensis]|nr:hypothetical protein NC651_008252 [Populus alba x Populus x berolinensis]